MRTYEEIARHAIMQLLARESTGSFLIARDFNVEFVREQARDRAEGRK